MDKIALREKIEAGVDGAQVVVEDLTGKADHFAVTVISDAFDGQSRIARHRMVYAALGDAMQGAIHALQLSTHTPTERRLPEAGQ